MIFFTADWHLGHDKVIVYANRPFSGMSHMSDVLARNYAERVTKRDTVYFLGDMVWRKEHIALLDALPGNKVYIPGNHDRKHFGFRDLTIKHLKYNKHGIDAYLSHFPLLTWPGRGAGAVNLHGHTHGMLPDRDNAMDVGVDCNGFYPVSLDEVIARFGLKRFKDLTSVD